MDPDRPRDYAAAAKLQELRESRGWSPEQVCLELKARDLPLVSGKTIRRIEHKGVIPQVRVRFALAMLFEVEVHDIWRLKVSVHS